MKSKANQHYVWQKYLKPWVKKEKHNKRCLQNNILKILTSHAT